MANISTSKPRVAVVGAGLAGLTSALQLAQRGYDVTLFEKSGVIGGNLSSTDGTHDVYPHMYCVWYKNFWHMLENDLQLDKDTLFAERAGVKLLDRGDPNYKNLQFPTDVQSIINNLRSGIEPPADLWIYGYGLIDLAAHDFDPDLLLNRSSVEGFLDGKYYSTERSASLFDLVLSEIWAVHFSHTSAADFQKFARRTITFPHYAPFALVLKGSVEEKIMGPFGQKLKALGCDIRLKHTVQSISVEGASIHLEVKHKGETEPHVADHLILAVPPEALGKLVRTGPPNSERRLVDFVPSLSEVQRLRADAIPVVEVHFNNKLDGIPVEHVALRGSPSQLTAVDISQLWTGKSEIADHTVIVLAASNTYALTSTYQHEDAYAMIREYHEYAPNFKLGTCWGDQDSDINWEKTYFQSNEKRKLYINTVRSVPSIPNTSYKQLPNVYFAGDFLINEAGMATIESATISGLKAAKALWENQSLGTPVDVEELSGYSLSTLLAFKLALGPSAYAARWWTLGRKIPGQLVDGDLKAASKSAAMMWRLPSAYAGDLMDTGYNFVASLFPDKK